MPTSVMSPISEPQPSPREASTPSPWDAVVVGGGAAGLFAALHCAQAAPGASIRVLERSHQALGKVRISGGGRCNVTHACFEPELLIRAYPRGGPALLRAFRHFQPRDTVAFFESHGVPLKTEPDGRMFPQTDRSETIVRCLLLEAERAGVVLSLSSGVQQIMAREEGGFRLMTGQGTPLVARRLLLATGGAEAGMRLAASLGHSLVPPVPSLFTFVLREGPLTGLAGVSVPDVRLRLPDPAGQGGKVEARGPLLFTHQGISGPAVLRLSAWGARLLHQRGYVAELEVSFVPEQTLEGMKAALNALRQTDGRRQVQAHAHFQLPGRLWERLVQAAQIPVGTRWAEVSRSALSALAEGLCRTRLELTGKNVHKEEFVTAGGVPFSEVMMPSLESRVCKGLFLAGEVLDYDGVTGGFNFQGAWTTGFLAGRGLASGL